MSSTVAISVLGDEFSFHHLAGLAVFGKDAHFVFSAQFDEMLEKLNRGETSHCMLAVENSIAGDVPGNFRRIADHHLHINGEILLQISLCLGALPGTKLSEIETILSHPMGRKECTVFFEQHPQAEFRPMASTASGARFIAENHIKNAGVITSKTAIGHYGLEVLAEAIDDHPGNTTRFLVLGRKSSTLKTTNKTHKASLILHLYDFVTPSSLDATLKEGWVLMKRELYENKIYLETSFTEISQFDQLLKTIPSNLCKTEVLGVYAEGRIISGL